MIIMLRKIFSPPIFPEDDEKSRSAYYLNFIVLSNIPILALFIIIRISSGSQILGTANIILLTIITILLLVWFLAQRGLVKLAGYLHVSTIWIASTLIALNGSGVRGTAFTSYFVVMLIAGLLLGLRPAIAYTLLSIAAAFGLAFAENAGKINYDAGPALNTAVESAVLFTFGGIFLYLIINSLQSTIRKEKTTANELRLTNQELTGLSSGLEIRVDQRTKELELQQQKAERRSRLFEGIIQVSKAISAEKNLQETLTQITHVISQQFGFYHAGIFLLDAANQFAILSAANSEGGIAMLKRGHQLKVGEQGIVGDVTASGAPRVVLDVGGDAIYFNNPDLPLTRAEMALPLKSGNQIIGALDIQSTDENAFTQEDIEVLSTLADQVSLAIQNGLLFDQTKKLLSESETIQRQYLKNTWSQLPENQNLMGYKYTITGTTALEEVELKHSMDQKTTKREVTVPITLRGETIGTLAVYVPADEKISPDQLDLIKAVAERVALSAENARLFDETARRAQREQLVSEITTKIRGTNDPQEMIRTAIEELQQALKISRVEIIPQKTSLLDR